MKMCFFVFIVFISLTLTRLAFANDVIVTISFDPHEVVSEELIAGTMTAEVMNLSSGAITNVNLRPEGVGDVAISREVLQFGSVSSGEAGVVHLSFHANQAFIDDAAPTTWRLDYDLAGGAHHQSIVTAE